MTDMLPRSPSFVPPAILLLAFMLDLAIGDPKWLPHPVRIIGSAISRAESLIRRFFKTPLQEKTGGVLLAAGIIVPVFMIVFRGVQALAGPGYQGAGGLLGIAVFIYLTSTTIAVKELTGSAQAVIDALKNKGLQDARLELSRIVGRDTKDLSDRDVLKATMETLAENLSDGIIAPVFYLVIGGLPLAVAYKAVNTLDSMVGYRNNRYINFGWAAARLDDAANYVPARLTGVLIAVAVFSYSVVKGRGAALRAGLDSLRIMLRDGNNHLSPNSGFPEAAMSGAIGVRMGGPSSYGGTMVEKPFIGENRTEDYMGASEDTINIVRAASALTLALAAIMLYIRGPQ